MRYLIGRYHEIALKGRNQWRFVDQLKSNLRAVFADFKLGAMRGEGPRLIVELPEEIDEEVAAERAALLFGLQNFSLSRPVARDIEKIKREAIAIARAHRSADTFACARRAPIKVLRSTRWKSTRWSAPRSRTTRSTTMYHLK